MAAPLGVPTPRQAAGEAAVSSRSGSKQKSQLPMLGEAIASARGNKEKRQLPMLGEAVTRSNTSRENRERNIYAVLSEGSSPMNSPVHALDSVTSTRSSPMSARMMMAGEELVSPARKDHVNPNSRSMYETSLYHKDHFLRPDMESIRNVRSALDSDAERQAKNYGGTDANPRAARFNVALPVGPQSSQKYSWGRSGSGHMPVSPTSSLRKPGLSPMSSMRSLTKKLDEIRNSDDNADPASPRADELEDVIYLSEDPIDDGQCEGKNMEPRLSIPASVAHSPRNSLHNSRANSRAASPTTSHACSRSASRCVSRAVSRVSSINSRAHSRTSYVPPPKYGGWKFDKATLMQWFREMDVDGTGMVCRKRVVTFLQHKSDFHMAFFGHSEQAEGFAHEEHHIIAQLFHDHEAAHHGHCDWDDFVSFFRKTNLLEHFEWTREMGEDKELRDLVKGPRKRNIEASNKQELSEALAEDIRTHLGPHQEIHFRSHRHVGTPDQQELRSTSKRNSIHRRSTPITMFEEHNGHFSLAVGEN